MGRSSGYSGSILRVDLSSGGVDTTPTDLYADRFLGGRGIAAKVHWDEVPPGVGAFDPENRLVMMTGPVCGVPGFAGSRWQVSGKSPYRERFSYCNLGGSWGAQLKSAGFDGLVVGGKADDWVYLLIDGDRVELRDASALRGRGAIETRKRLKDELGDSFRIVAVGPAGENQVNFATMTADLDSSGAGGLGAVMGSKNLKAVAVRGGRGRVDVADPEALGMLRERVKETKPPPQPWPTMLPRDQIDKEICFGCINGCIRQSFRTKDGRAGKYTCQSAVFYEIRAYRYYGEVNDVPFLANKLCDDYGMDTRPVETMIMWLSRCHKAGLLSEKETGLPFSKMGSLEFIKTLLRKISFREGFGEVLAEGAHQAAEAVGRESGKLITDYMTSTGENDIYGSRMYITTGLIYAMEPRMPIQQLHQVSELGMLWAARETGQEVFLSLQDNYMTSDVLRRVAKRFWGSEIMADFSTYEGKAVAAAQIQDREFAKESLILCDLSWPIMHSPNTPDHVGDPTLESRVCAAVTGNDLDEAGLNEAGERVFNLQRAVLVREGQMGKAHDTIDEYNFTAPLRGDVGNPECLVPGKDGEPFSRKGAVVDRAEFAKMRDEYYAVRGWDVATGLQTKAKLKQLGLGDVAQGLEEEGLVR